MQSHAERPSLTLQERLNTLRSGQTTIIVAHRLSTVMDADIIIVMQVAPFASPFCPNFAPNFLIGTGVKIEPGLQSCSLCRQLFRQIAGTPPLPCVFLLTPCPHD